MSLFVDPLGSLRRGVAMARARRLASRAPDADAIDEVQLLVDADPAAEPTLASRHRTLQFAIPLLHEGLRCRVWPARPARQRATETVVPQPDVAQRLTRWRQRRARRRDFHALAGRGVVWLHRDLMAALDSSLEEELPLHNRHVVVDLDAATFLRPPWTRGVGIDGVDGALRDKIARLCRVATVVTAGNRYLAEFAREHNPHVHVLPTALCTDEFHPPPQPPSNARPVLGWFGPASELWYLRALGPALHQLARKRDFVLQVVTDAVDAAGLAGLPTDRLELIRWRDDDLVARIQRFDVGIVPLIDDGWTSGKPLLELARLMACGVPFVASPLAEVPAIGGDDGLCGVHAAHANDWIERLDVLLDDREWRHILGRRGRERATRQHDRRAHAPALAAILREAARD